jgi:hypothetical protein
MSNAHAAHLPSSSLYVMMTMLSEKVRIVAENQKASQRQFNVTRVSAGNVPTLPAIFPDGIAPVRRTDDDERELLNIRWRMLGPQFCGGATNIRGGAWRAADYSQLGRFTTVSG